jgi:carbon-monoxide dehydrogenase medium subunit
VWQDYVQASSIDEVLKILHEKGERARVIAGGTDLILEMERGVRQGIETLVDITRIPGLDTIRLTDETIHIGALATHNDCAASRLVRDHAYPLARAAWEVGAPQIRNRGTVAGNVITASPANDTITPLMALGAIVALRSLRGERRLPLADFYKGVRKTALEADEMLVEIEFRAMTPEQRGTFVKVALRRAQAISLVNVAMVVTMQGREVADAAIALGAVAPTIIRASEAESALSGRSLTDDTIAHVAALAMDASTPIDDIRGSASYRHELVRVAVSRGLTSIRDHREREGFPVDPILLVAGHEKIRRGKGRSGARSSITDPKSSHHAAGSSIQTTINGRTHSFQGAHDKTLLRLLREEAGLTGTKEGCAEGECGACTVFLDGKAVMSCLVPAPAAHGAAVVTVEGLRRNHHLHPMQQAFIHQGAVQCGYCTPGFIMSGAKLLEEKPRPTRDEIGQALTGNLCRCTGYFKIIQAVESASLAQAGQTTS